MQARSHEAMTVAPAEEPGSAFVGIAMNNCAARTKGA